MECHSFHPGMTREEFLSMGYRPLWDNNTQSGGTNPLIPKSFREKSLSEWGFQSVGPSLLHGTTRRSEWKHMFKRSLCELLKGKGRRTHVGTISAHHGPQEPIRIDTRPPPEWSSKSSGWNLKCHHLPLYMLNLFFSLSVHQIHQSIRSSIRPSIHPCIHPSIKLDSNYYTFIW